MLAVVLAPELGLALADLPLGLLVALVPDYDEGEVLRVLDASLLDELLLPVLHAVEALKKVKKRKKIDKFRKIEILIFW